MVSPVGDTVGHDVGDVVRKAVVAVVDAPVRETEGEKVGDTVGFDMGPVGLVVVDKSENQLVTA